MGLVFKGKAPIFNGGLQVEIPTPTYSGKKSNNTADSINPYTSQGPGDAGAGLTASQIDEIRIPPNIGIVQNQVFYLDSGYSESYSGTGQIWNNLTENPADGSSSGEYNFYYGSSTGADSGDPSFVGTPGNRTPGEYMSFDGTDIFQKNGAENTTFTNNFAKTGQQYTFVIWMRTGGTVNPAWHLSNNASTSGSGILYGHAGFTSSRQSILIRPANYLITADAAVSANTIYMFGLSYNHNSSSFFYRNGNYDQVSSSNTFTPTYTGGGNAQGRLTLGANSPNLTEPYALGHRLYIARCWNRALSKSEMDAEWFTFRGRFGL